MARVVITIKVMPDSPETDLQELTINAKNVIEKHGGEVGKEEIEPVAFGLKAIKLTFIRDEAKGGADAIEAELAELEGVTSAEVIDVRRAIG